MALLGNLEKVDYYRNDSSVRGVSNPCQVKRGGEE